MILKELHVFYRKVNVGSFMQGLWKDTWKHKQILGEFS